VYEWRVPGKPVSITLDLGVARVLRRDVSGAPEIGGLLLGRVHSGPVQRVQVDDCEPFAWASEMGGAPHLDDHRRAVFEATLRRWQPASGAPLSVVGF